MSKQVRFTPAQFKALKRQEGNPPPRQPGRAPRRPKPADSPPERDRLLSVEVAPPKASGGFWVVTARFVQGTVTMDCVHEEQAQQWAAAVKKAHFLQEKDFEGKPK